MSSEQSSTPPSTPVHSTSMEEDKMMEEVGGPFCLENLGLDFSSCFIDDILALFREFLFSVSNSFLFYSNDNKSYVIENRNLVL